MISIKNAAEQVAVVKGQDVQVTSTLGSLDTLSFNFYNLHTNKVDGDVLAPFSVISVPEKGEDYVLQTYNTDDIGNYIQYSVSAIQIAKMFHYHYIKDKIGVETTTTKSGDSTDTSTTSKPVKIKDALNFLFKDSGFEVVIGADVNQNSVKTFSDGLGGGYADELLQTAATSYGVEYYWKNKTCYVAKEIGGKDKFVFVDNVNCTKISVQEDDTAITTRATGTINITKQNGDNSSVNTLTSTYVSPLVKEKGWPIIDATPYTEDFTDDGKSFVMSQQLLDDKVKKLVHDYPSVQYTVDGANFKKFAKYLHDVNIGDYGYLRTRQGIDVETRVQSITSYPQDPSKGNTITFGNLAFNLIDYVTYQHNQQDKYREWYISMSLKMNNLADIVHKANAGLDKFTTTWGESQLENTQSIEKLQQELQQLIENQKDKDKDTTDKGNNENDNNSTKQST
ncbi:phage tail protein [Lactobacillus gasseri]|uniref:Tail spike domain-containing protein n=1 Tax=Lactobacillus gasseri TaxID=1596 RepID=A0AB33C860_LACGS|nr:phage tail protein [Lactobacillus gasseri]ART99101.1 hypothetical protein CCE30_09485 [Lactobacillus gasseri]EJN54704.1 Phage minor structural protein, N-terminal domain protein [Lactobacillus gasseri CECT 5714]MBV6739553.1 phage tail protein [Lactobacillus gasseri CECT 5714]QTP20682.1 hypothetical protein J7S35_001166 [Lactobacillus gasseri]